MHQSFFEQVITPGGLSPEELVRVQKFYETMQATTAQGSTLGRIPRTYAEALIAVAEVRGVVTEVGADFHDLIYDVFPAIPNLEAYLDSPAVHRKQKDAFITHRFEGKANPLFVDFLRLLNRKDRLGMLRFIGIAARTIMEERANRQRVLVETAVELSEEQKKSLIATLSSFTGKTPVLVMRVSPGLIGGLIVHVGDRVFDSSVSTQLSTVRKKLLSRGSDEIQSRRDFFSTP